ncbi:hypothetical protein WG66_010870 [Moniliophthora roreri]|nr:hypothetical protein WG66_010870 [Moniliophthora roreri]
MQQIYVIVWLTPNKSTMNTGPTAVTKNYSTCGRTFYDDGEHVYKPRVTMNQTIYAQSGCFPLYDLDELSHRWCTTPAKLLWRVATQRRFHLFSASKLYFSNDLKERDTTLPESLGLTLARETYFPGFYGEVSSPLFPDR